MKAQGLMLKIKGRAGRNIRLLAFTRRYKAIYSFIGAGIMIYLPFALTQFTNAILKPLAESNPDAVASSSIPPIIYIAFVVFAISLIANGIFLWKRANHADQGAKGEEDTAHKLKALAHSGWQIKYGKRLGKGIGDIDIICVSPNNKTYVIDVKSHKGVVFTDGKKLYRRMGKTQYSFEKDFLSQVTKQALRVKKKTDTKFVTPIVAFSTAKVSITSGKVKHVHVVEKSKLLSLLKSLG